MIWPTSYSIEFNRMEYFFAMCLTTTIPKIHATIDGKFPLGERGRR